MPSSAQDCVAGGGAVQVFAVVDQSAHWGPGQLLVRVWVIVPVCPVVQDWIRVSELRGVHCGGGVDTVQDCVTGGLLDVQSVSTTLAFVEEIQNTERDCTASTHGDQVPVFHECVIGRVPESPVSPEPLLQFVSAARVAGPVAP